MVQTSPLANPGPYITKVNDLSEEAVTIDNGVARASREAAEFATKFSANFELVSELQASTDKFSILWVSTLQQTRDAASSISAWYQRFVQVFLSLIDGITSEGDVRDIITEFNSLLTEEFPSKKYRLDRTPGVKRTFNEIEEVVPAESQHIIDVLEKAKSSTWRKIVDDLKQELVPVKIGAERIRQALNSYATRLE